MIQTISQLRPRATPLHVAIPQKNTNDADSFSRTGAKQSPPRPIIDPRGAIKQCTQRIKAAPNFAAAMRILGEMHTVGLRGTTETFNAVLRKANCLDHVATVLKVMSLAGVHGDSATYTTMLSKSPTFEHALGTVHTLTAAGVQVTVHGYATLAGKAQSVGDAKQVLHAMHQAGLPGNAAVYNAVLPKCRTFREMASLLNNMRRYNVRGDRNTQALLRSKVRAMVAGNADMALFEAVESMAPVSPEEHQLKAAAMEAYCAQAGVSF